MRTTTDALRSLARYMFHVLGPEWEVRLWHEQGAFAYPFCRVEKAGATVVSGTPYYASCTQPMTVHCYPAPGETVEQSIFAAGAVEELLIEGFQIGVQEGRFMRIPLFDYEGVPLEGATAFSDTRLEHDFMRVADCSISAPRHDPEDEREVAVIADIRVSWMRPGRIPGGTPLESVRVQIEDAS